MGENYWVVIPAAGVGKRMQLNHPKQYLSLHGKTVLEHAVSCFDDQSLFKGIVIPLSADDSYWPSLTIHCGVPIHPAQGGSERCFSVLNGLRYLKDKAQKNDWVLVHDAARPCLRQEDIAKLVTKLKNHAVGGLLGLPVADTLKLCGANQRVKRTVSRSGLWRALTPQMFRYQILLDALEFAIRNPARITDEASAIEAAGHEPVMVEGFWDNIKITHPQDIRQAEMILNGRKKS